MLGMFLLSPGGTGWVRVLAQGSPTPSDDERIDALFATYEALAASIDPVTVDVQELSFELAFEDPDTIAQWVASNISYHPYRGVLRGASGTLLALGGNSLDQALLLAKLLTDAGYEARIAYAAVPDDRAEEMWRSASAAPDREPPSSSMSATVASSAPLSEDQIADAQQQVQESYRALDATFVRERDALAQVLSEDAGLDLGSLTAPRELYETTYAWVDVRSSPEGPWQRYHPVFASPPDWVDALEPDELVLEAVPVEVQHRLRFQAVIEQRLGDELQEHPITAAWERPIANLAGSAFSVMTVPDTLATDPDASADLTAAFESATFIYPVFQGELAPGAQLFDLNGNTAPPEAAASPAAGIFQSVGNAFGGAAGALSGQEEAVALSAMWLEFTLIEPGGAETVHRRAIFDRVGAENRAAGSTEFQASIGPDVVVEALQSTHTFMVDPGAYPVDYVHLKNATTMLEHEGYIRSLYAGDATTPGGSVTPPDELSATMRALDHFRQFLLFDARAIEADELTYRNRPALSLISKRWDGTHSRTDVIQNDRISLATADDGAVRFAAARTHEMGIWETVAEGVALGRADDVFSVPSYMQAAREEGIPTAVLHPTDSERLAEVDVPVESREAMRRDLDRGYLVVTPTGRPAGEERAAWWRVHPETGVTLGRGLDGRGVQEGFTYASLTISIAFGVAGALACVGGGGSAGCCVAEGVGWFALGLALGAAIGAIGGWLAFGELAVANVAFSFGAAFDFATFNMGLAGILPTGCSPSSRIPRDGWDLAYRTDRSSNLCAAGPMLGIDLDGIVAAAGPNS